jgi:hypothetical protein
MSASTGYCGTLKAPMSDFDSYYLLLTPDLEEPAIRVIDCILSLNQAMMGSLSRRSDRFEEKEPDGSLRHLPGKCAVRVLEVSATHVGRPPVLGTPRFSSCAARWARIWLPKWPQTHIYSAMSVWEWTKVRSWLGKSRIVRFHAIGTGILGRTLWRTLHLNPSI